MIDNIIFDIGRVLFDYHPHDVVAQLLPNDTNTDFYVTYFHDNDIWQELDHGTITALEAAEKVCQYQPNTQTHPTIKKNILHIINHFHLKLPPITPIINLYKQVLKSHNVYLLTNFQDKPFDNLCQAYPFLTQANGAIVSAKEKCMKPDPQIYKLLLKRYQLNPKKTLFIDDKAENIATAQSLGIYGIIHRTNKETIETVTKMITL